MKRSILIVLLVVLAVPMIWGCDGCNKEPEPQVAKAKMTRPCPHCHGTGFGPGATPGVRIQCRWCQGTGRDLVFENMQ